MQFSKFRKLSKLIFILFFISFSFSLCPQVTKWWDCWLVQLEDIDGAVSKIPLDDFKIVTKDDIKTALNHLIEYCKCCSEWKCSTYRWAESPFLFDQLVDIVFRKLDGIEDLSYVKVDDDAKNWRNYMDKIAESPDWYKPEDINKQFLKYRAWNWILYKKYLYACDEIAKTIKHSLWLVPWNTISEKSKTSFSYWKSLLYTNCIYLFKNRYNKEYNLVKYYMIRKWNQMLANYWTDYVSKDFIDKQWQRLLEKFSKFLGYLTRIVKLIWDWTKNCNK